MTLHGRFPWDLLVGILGTIVAGLSVRFVIVNSGQQFDTVILNDHVVGGTFDKMVALAVATVFGGAAVFAFLAFHRRISSPPRIGDRVSDDRP